MEIVLEGDPPAFSEVDASDASCVAINHGISDEYQLALSDEQVNAAAHEAERAYHGEKPLAYMT